MKALRRFFRTRTGRLVLHDGAIALGVGYATWDAAGHSFTWGAASVAAAVVAKAFLRLILPVPAAPDAPPAPRRKRGDHGLTLVELLVAILVIVVVLLLIGAIR